MKKLILCSSICAVFSVLCLGDNAFAGAFSEIALKLRSSVNHAASNEYYWSNVEKKLIECDNDNGDAGDYVMAIGVLDGGKIKAAKQCILTDTGDYWSPRGEIQECKPQSQKKAYWDIPGGGGHKIWRTTDKQFKKLTDGSTIVFDTSSHVSRISDIACIECAQGYYFANESAGCVQNPVDQECTGGKTRAIQDISIIGICTGEMCTPIKKGECYDDEYLKCMEASAIYKDPANWNGTSCNCGDKQVWNSKKARCEQKGGGGGSSCEQKYKGYPERIACCKYPASVTTWEPRGATPTNGRCECVDKTTKWTYVPGQYTGQCMPVGGCDSLSGDAKLCCEAGGTWNATTNTCDCGEGRKWDTAKKQCVQDNSNVLSDCIYRFNGKVKCANGNSLTINQQRPLTVAELGGMSCDQFNNLYQSDVSKLNEFFTNACNGGAFISIVTGPSDAEVKNAQSVLSAFFSTAQSNASVWKNAEGKFNTARLASDLTAGVVLGSVGGVVSGVVIKKNQVKKGFEALHCAVGGQKVADWGDEFNVGLR